MSDIKYAYLKYTHTFAYGNGETKIKMLPEEYKNDKELCEEYIENLADEYNWSDKYRGIDYEWLEFPDEDWINKEIGFETNRIKMAETRIKALKDLMREKHASEGHHSV